MPSLPDLPLRLHMIVSRMSREGGDPEEQATIGEAAARIVHLEQRVGDLCGPEISEMDALRTAKLLVEAHGEQEAWRMLTARALDEHVKGNRSARAITQQVLAALRKLTVKADGGKPN